MAQIFRVSLNEFIIIVKADSIGQVSNQFNISQEIDNTIMVLTDFLEDAIVDMDLTESRFDVKYRSDWLKDKIPFRSGARVNIDCIDCVDDVYPTNRMYACKNPFVRMMSARCDPKYQVLTACCRRFPKQFIEHLTAKQNE